MKKERIKKRLDDVIVIPVVFAIIMAAMWLCNYLSAHVLAM